MRRRDLIAYTVTCLMLPRAAAEARQTCTPATPWQQPSCIAEVDLNEIVYAEQEESQWCWAAAVQMIFGFYGFGVSQEEIVVTIYGDRVNRTSGPPSNISSLLSRDWESADGRKFRSRVVGLFDALAGVNALNNMSVINALQNGRPLLYCNRSHAMVLTAIAYVPTPGEPNVFNIGLVDPWPGIGARGAQPGELTPIHFGGSLTYLALPRVQEI